MADLIKNIEDKLNEGRQYRNIQVGNIELRSENDDEMIVEGYATTFNEPYELFTMDNYTVREQVDPHAFDECSMDDVIMQYNHEGRVFARTKNGTLQLDTDPHGLHIRADLSGTELGREVFSEIKGGYTNKMSFGFIVTEDKREDTEDKQSGHVDILRTITKIGRLFDVSAVSIPANDATAISARAYGEGVIAEVAEECRKREDRERLLREIKEICEVSE